MTTQEQLIVRAGIVVPRWIRGGPLLTEAGVVVRDGVIVEVSAFDALRRRYPQVDVVGRSDQVLVPGFINGHSHGRGLSTLLRGVHDLPLELRLPWLRAAQPVDPRVDTLLSCVLQLEHGVTGTVHIDSYYGGGAAWYFDRVQVISTAYADSGIRFAFGLGIRDRNDVVYGERADTSASEPARSVARLSADEYAQIVDRLADGFPGTSVQYAPTNPVWCSDPLLERIGHEARRTQRRIHIHLLETYRQRIWALQEYGRTAVAHLQYLGLLTPMLACAHCVWVTDGDRGLLRDTGAVAVHNPSSNLRLGSGIAPVRAFREDGISLAIGMDSLSINDDEDMLQELRLAHVLHRLPGPGTGSVDAVDLLQASTEGGAAVLGVANVGRLEPGWLADLVLVRLPQQDDGARSPEELADRLVQWHRSTEIDTVIVGGHLVVKDGVHVALARDELLRQALASRGDAGAVDRDLANRIERYYADWPIPNRPFYDVNAR